MLSPTHQKLCNQILSRKAGDGEINSVNESDFSGSIRTVTKNQIKISVIYLYINDKQNHIF